MQEKNELEIFEPPQNRRYWIVKADGGRLYDVFINNSLIAIGHFNSFASESDYSSPFQVSSGDIKRKMTRFRDSKAYYNSNNYGQVNSFINEINIGDWVLTKAHNVIRIGRIESEARLETGIEKTVINKNFPHEKTVEMDFMLKRTVCWGPEIKIEHLPTDVFLSLKTPMTLYNIDKYMKSICYTLYPFFKIGNELHFTIRINQKNEISNFYITKVFEYLNELEFLSKLESYLGNNEEINRDYQQFILNGGFSLSTQASFHSPGDIWAKLGFSKSKPTAKMMNAIVIYSMLFGNSHLGIDGVMDIDSRKLLWETLIKRIDMSVTEEASRELELSMPKYETKEIERLVNDEPIKEKA